MSDSKSNLSRENIKTGFPRGILMFSLLALMFCAVAYFQSLSLALTILNLCLISAIMSLGLNIQWGYAGLLNVGVMGFAALGGVAAILISMPPVAESWAVGGAGLAQTVIALVITMSLALLAHYKLKPPFKGPILFAIIIIGYFIIRSYFDPATEAIEKVNPASTGYLGGLGLPITLSWIIGGLFAAAAAWLVGKISLGLRSDYLAIATLGISEIIIAILKNEDWLTRGVKNVTALPRPVPYEVDIQQSPDYIAFANDWGISIIELSAVIVKLSYAGLFAVILLALIWLTEKALHSPWGRMMRAIRDNETAAEAMGKNVKGRHLQVFVLGSAIIGIAGAMLVTLDGQFTPSSYTPLRFTFLIWVMVIVGGSGNNWGSILGGFIIWFFWIEAEPMGLWLLDFLTSGMAENSPLRLHLLESAAHMRLMTMGLILLLVLRFSPRGLLPEK